MDSATMYRGFWACFGSRKDFFSAPECLYDSLWKKASRTLNENNNKRSYENRCVEQYWQRGGNASNNCSVLSRLGTPCSLLATLAVTHELGFLQESLKCDQIDYDLCVYHTGCQCPISVAILNQHNGSRTILHSNKTLPELTEDDFKTKVDLPSGKFKWIHFEGRRTVASIKAMLEHVNTFNSSLQNDADKITTSVELEKRFPELDDLAHLADYIFVSKEHALMSGYQNKEDAVEGFIKLCKPGAAVICPWGELGAAATTHQGPTETSACFPPASLVDTLGAGDTFIAATITSLHRGGTLKEALVFGCKVAGAKCGMQGFGGLRQLFNVGPS